MMEDWSDWDVVSSSGYQFSPKPGQGLIATDIITHTVTVDQVAAYLSGQCVLVHAIGLDLIGKPGRDAVAYFIRSQPVFDAPHWYAAFADFDRIDPRCETLLGTTQGYISPAPSHVVVTQTINTEIRDSPADGRHYYMSFTFSKLMVETLRGILKLNENYHASVDHVLIIGLPSMLPSCDTPLGADIPFAPMRARQMDMLMIGHLDDNRQITHVSMLTETCLPEAQALEQAALIRKAEQHHADVKARHKPLHEIRAEQGILSALFQLISRKP